MFVACGHRHVIKCLSHRNCRAPCCTSECRSWTWDPRQLRSANVCVCEIVEKLQWFLQLYSICESTLTIAFSLQPRRNELTRPRGLWKIGCNRFVRRAWVVWLVQTTRILKCIDIMRPRRMNHSTALLGADGTFRRYTIHTHSKSPACNRIPFGVTDTAHSSKMFWFHTQIHRRTRRQAASMHTTLPDSIA